MRKTGHMGRETNFLHQHTWSLLGGNKECPTLKSQSWKSSTHFVAH